MEKVIEKMLDKTGIKLNGSNPWDMQVHDKRVFNKIVREPSLGLGEAYVDGWWDCSRLDQFFERVNQAKIDKDLYSPKVYFDIILNRLFNFQDKSGSQEVIKKHYDLGNDLFELMLDKSMNYSCGYWKKAVNLDEAQQDKMELICRKLLLKPGMRLLDIGCGWGGMAKYAAENYGVEVVGITLSSKQKKLADERCRGLPVTIKLTDYRDLKGETFDRVVSVGMFEHVGYKNYEEYMRVVHSFLVEDGLFLLHTIGNNHSVVSPDPWLDKYIFPNSMLPSVAQIGKAIEDFFIMEDWHNFGQDYDKTLMAWHRNFNLHWPALKEAYGERFYRMWNYYLLLCAGTFRARKIQLWQVLLSKSGLRNSIRPTRDL